MTISTLLQKHLAIAINSKHLFTLTISFCWSCTSSHSLYKNILCTLSPARTGVPEHDAVKTVPVYLDCTLEITPRHPPAPVCALLLLGDHQVWIVYPLGMAEFESVLLLSILHAIFHVASTTFSVPN